MMTLTGSGGSYCSLTAVQGRELLFENGELVAKIEGVVMIAIWSERFDYDYDYDAVRTPFVR